MNRSDSIKEIASALAKAQPEIKSAIKDSTNPHFKSNYADFTAIVEACRPALSKHGLSFVQPASSVDGKTATVTMMLMHNSGEWISDSLTLQPMKPDAQGIGSALTYARRYTLASMLGVPTEDDDGNGASGPSAPPAAQRPVAPRPAAPVDPLQAAVAKWSGVAGTDLVAAMRSCAAAAGVKIEGRATPEQKASILAWVNARAAAGESFAAATAKKGKD